MRRLLPSDRDELARRYAELSDAARRARFGAPSSSLSPQLLDHLVDLDFDDRYALAAIALDEPGTPGVGVARYARDPADPDSAEVAVVVLDRYQRRGIGTVLLWDLVDAARAHGIAVLTGSVAWQNADLLDAIRCLGATVVPTEPGIAAVRLALADFR